MSVFDYFIGTTQSKYASIAMFLTILTICVAILVTNTDVSLGMRFGIVFFVILISIFPICLSLFELTCLVTGGRNTKYNLCNYFAWFVTVMIIVYSFILIIMIISSMFTYKKAQDKITMTDNMNKISSGDANKIAANMLKEGFESKAAAVEDVVKPSVDASVSDTAPQSPAIPSVPSVPSVPSHEVPKMPTKMDEDEKKKGPVSASMSQFANYMPF